MLTLNLEVGRPGYTVFASPALWKFVRVLLRAWEHSNNHIPNPELFQHKELWFRPDTGWLEGLGLGFRRQVDKSAS